MLVGMQRPAHEEKRFNGFDARCGDRWALDVPVDLAAIIEGSWARKEAIPPCAEESLS
ncbi:MAG: hypothetical protein ACYCZL_08845 [Polaromonas sp.]